MSSHIRTRITVAIAATSFAIAALAGCATGQAGSSTAGSGAAGPSSPASSPGASSTVLTTASTPLGTIVVDGAGRTVYVFDEDTAGAASSACAGQCATAWPAVESDSASPSVAGVKGAVGTITGTDGKLQVTLNGLPLYTFAADTAAGDLKGQGVGGSWWALGSGGAKISGGATGIPATPAATAPNTPSTPTGYSPKGNY